MRRVQEKEHEGETANKKEPDRWMVQQKEYEGETVQEKEDEGERG